MESLKLQSVLWLLLVRVEKAMFGGVTLEESRIGWGMRPIHYISSTLAPPASDEKKYALRLKISSRMQEAFLAACQTHNGGSRVVKREAAPVKTPTNGILCLAPLEEP